MVTKLRHVNMPPGAEQMRGGVRGMDAQQSAAAAREESSLRRENERLRAELDGVQRLLYEGGSTKDLVQLQLEKARIAAERNTERNSAIDLGASHNSSSCAIAEIVLFAVDLCSCDASFEGQHHSSHICCARFQLTRVCMQGGRSRTQRHAP